MHLDGTGEPHQLGGGVQGAGQVVGHEAQGRHLGRAPARRPQPERAATPGAVAGRFHVVVPPSIGGANPAAPSSMLLVV
jgi:hypothetical protein